MNTFSWQTWTHALVRMAISWAVAQFFALPIIVKSLETAGVTVDQTRLETALIGLSLVIVEGIRNRLKHGGSKPREGIKKLL